MLRLTRCRVSSVARTSVAISAIRPKTSLIRKQIHHAAPQSGSSAVVDTIFAPLDTFTRRHVGPNADEIQFMLRQIGYDSMDAFIRDTVPENIRINEKDISDETHGMRALSESELLKRAYDLAKKNKVFKSYIGMGYHTAVVPPVILRNITENPAWYTQYSPYQAEISQGRLESLINFQTVCTSLTGLDISNASLLDEGTAAAEAMIMAFGNSKKKRTFLVDRGVLPQTLAVLKTRAAPFGINLKIGSVRRIMGLRDSGADEDVLKDMFGVLVQYPNTRGEVIDWSKVADKAHEHGALCVAATDLLALTMLKPPGEWGADIAVGNSARFGVPLGYGGPHAAFFSCTDALKRKMPGRIIGLSKDTEGNPAYRLALQTREQHIRREKATSNICTAQALLANMAAMYAVYHGPDGLRRIAGKVHSMTALVKGGLEKLGHSHISDTFFDTLTLSLSSVAANVVHEEARQRGINLREIDGSHVGITLDEATTLEDVMDLLNAFSAATVKASRRFKPEHYTRKTVLKLAEELGLDHADLLNGDSKFIPDTLQRTSKFMEQPIFNTHHSETEMLRYIHLLQSKDLSLVHACIPLGSCTMKLNPTASMIPLTVEGFSNIHPFVPQDQAIGYQAVINELSESLSKITGFPAISLQPNSGAQGEYAGLSTIRSYHRANGQEHRDICLIPVSAHGTNPASAIMAGMKVVPVKTLANGNLDFDDLKAKAEKHKDNLAAFMVTYPSTFGVFEDGVQEACDIIHKNGGQVYLDGANMNAQIGLTHPAKCGADVCHLNLHKTFAIPHGGGGPGQGPIGVAKHLAPFLPNHPVITTGGKHGNAISAAPFGSASILLISWAYIKMLGGDGLTHSSKLALLNANYAATRLKDHYKIRYTNTKGKCAHEFIIDFAEFESTTGLKVMDFAKRLQDFGIHPPTCSWPISTCMLIEPTESESLAEIDRFCDAMITIRKEADAIASGKQRKDNNVIKNAPHPISVIVLPDDKWNRPYTREEAAYPDRRLRKSKFWPSVSRVDDAYGDRNLMCECPSVEEVADSTA